jgi:FkbM family methyltransferase
MTKLQRVLRHMRRFGLGTGWQALRLYASRGARVPLRLPGVGPTLWARPGTADVPTFEEVFVAREYDLPFSDFSPRDIVDLGANIGYASVYFSARWPGVNVLSVEPDAQNVELLGQNTKYWPRIMRLQGAVWSHPARVCVANPSDASNAFQMRESSQVSEDEGVAAYTVSQLIDTLGCDRLDLLKMDVEGAEREILQTSHEWLDRVKVLVVELHDRLVPGCAAALHEAIAGRRYRMEIVGANLAFDFR